MTNVLKANLYKVVNNLLGYHTNNKYIIFESDDWGSIRMPSNKVYNSLLKNNIRVDKDPYCKFDSIATSHDIELLFDVLSRFKDSHGNHPIFTANALMANPDFDKIKENDFQQYHFETFTKTLERYAGSENAFNLWKIGLENGLFYPQLHGREHLNISKWINYLNSGNKAVRLAFDNEMYCLSNVTSCEIQGQLVAAFSENDTIINNTYSKIIKDASTLFYEHFGNNSLSFIAPNYAWSNEIERATASVGVKFLQGNFAQYNTQLRRAKYNYTGKKNNYDQIYLTRNCVFEPSLDNSIDWVSSCLSDIDFAFKFKKPAIIGTHRLNYVGRLNEKNRDRNLVLLEALLGSMLKKWPEIEFITSDKLGDLILNN
jgi:hypothetical protein